MRPKKKRQRLPYALTLLEMIIAIALMAIVYGAILPQFRNIANSWDSRRQSSEALQSGRVLTDHIRSNLARAVKITAVSSPSVKNGYIQFEAADGKSYRYEVSKDKYVYYGVVGKLRQLAGPVTQLQFTCYDAYDLDKATTDVDEIRCVKTVPIMANAAKLSADKEYAVISYLRTNGYQPDVLPGSSFIFDRRKAKTPDLIEVAKNRFLCVYSGEKDRGKAVILIVNPKTWRVSRGAAFVFDPRKGKTPVVCEIQKGTRKTPARYLCVYTGDRDKGRAVVLNVDMRRWRISGGTPFEFERSKAKAPALAKMPNSNFLCAYSGDRDKGWAVVLRVDKRTRRISRSTPYRFEGFKAKTPSLARIDDYNYLCAYSGGWFRDCGMAVVLRVDKKRLTIRRGWAYMFDIFRGKTPALERIDDRHFLCAYSGGWFKDRGAAVVLGVSKRTWRIGKGWPILFDVKKGKSPVLAPINILPKGVSRRADFLCVYTGDRDRGRSIVLKVDTRYWTIKKGSPADYDSYGGYYQWEDDKAKVPALCAIDSRHFLCAYSGGRRKNRGYAIVLEVYPPVLP